MKKIFCLNRNVLKLIAVITMIVDHTAVVFFPRVMILRIIGRISFPIFAYFISEGAKYTKNKLRYFLNMAIMGLFFQKIYGDFVTYPTINEFLDYSIAILLIYLFQFVKKTLFDFKSIKRIIFFSLSSISLVALLIFIYYLTTQKVFEYGYLGVIMPFILSLFDFSTVKNKKRFMIVLDSRIFKYILLILTTILLALPINTYQTKTTCYYQSFGVLALIPMFFYNGQNGKWNIKHFFYLFYPIHLVILEGLYYLIHLLNK